MKGGKPDQQGSKRPGVKGCVPAERQLETAQKKPLLDCPKHLSCKAKSSNSLWIRGDSTGLYSCRSEQLVS